MSNPEIVKETNILLKQVLELEEERKRKAEESKVQIDEMKKKWEDKKAAKPVKLEDPDFEGMRKNLQEEGQKRIEEGVARERAHRELVVAEMNRQTELLERILAVLES
jgi:hypothetical protein